MRFATVSRFVSLALVNAMLIPLDVSSAFAAAPQASQTAAENVQVVVNGGVVRINYDLVAPASAQALDVALEISEDGGATYSRKPQTVTGDVGARVAPGSGKRIDWDAAKDTDNLELAQLRFRVVVGTGGIATPGLSAVSGPSGPATQPASLEPVLGVHRRNSWLWPSVGLMTTGVFILWAADAGPLKRLDPYWADYCNGSTSPQQCRDYFSSSDNKVENVTLEVAGLAIAAGGATLLILGHRRASHMPSIAPLPGGFIVRQVVNF